MQVLTTASVPPAQVVREAGGADAVLDPMAWQYMARTLESGFDTESGGVLKPGAKYCHILSTDWAPNEQETSVLVVLQGPFEKWRSWFRQRFVDPAAPRLFSTPVQPDADALTTLARLVDDGRIRPVIDRTFDGLTSAVDAVEYLETGRARGKVVIRVSAHEERV
jgi:NADPH:quinone reductase-like Zn-dependent oxidoreductase